MKMLNSRNKKPLILVRFSVLFTLTGLVDTSKNLTFDCSTQQFWERKFSKDKCTANGTIYHCAYDIFAKEYREICREKSILIRIGYRPTIQGGLHYGKCPQNRYQPFHIISNKTTDCWYQKSLCSELGQIVHNDASPDSDTTCRCDYTEGYAFVQVPRNQCFCTPSVEDCSCFLKKCNNSGEILNPDYECVKDFSPLDLEHGIKTKCQPLENTDTQFPTESSTGALPVQDRLYASNSSSSVLLFILAAFLFFVATVLFLFCASPIWVRFVKDNEKNDSSIQLKVKVIGVSLKQVEWYCRTTEQKSKRRQLSGGVAIRKGLFFRYLTIQVPSPQTVMTYECIAYNRIGQYFRHERTVQTDWTTKKKKNNTFTTEKMQQFENESAVFYITDGVKQACNVLNESHVVVLVGGRKSGKSWTSYYIGRQCKDNGYKVYMYSDKKYITIIDEMMNDDDKECFLLDFNLDSSMDKSSLEELLSQLKSFGKTTIKIIITAQTMELIQECNLETYVQLGSFTPTDKRCILENYMRKYGIKTCKNYSDATINNSSLTGNKNNTVRIYEKVIDQIVEAETVECFPEYCRLFCSNKSLLQLEDRYFKNPSKALIKEISLLRSDKDTLVKYVCLIYILKQNRLDGTALNVDEDVIESICNDFKPATFKAFAINDAAVKLEKENKICLRNGGYELCNEITKRAVWTSYLDVNASYCVMECPWSYVEDLIRPFPWQLDENDVCYPIKEGLEARLDHAIFNEGLPWLVGVYLSKVVNKNKEFVDSFCERAKSTFKKKSEIAVSFINGTTDNGQNIIPIIKCCKLVELLQWDGLVQKNCFLHYGVINNYKFLSNPELCTELKGLVTICNSKNVSAMEIAFLCGRYEIAKTHEGSIPLDYHYVLKLKKMHSKGRKQTKQIIENRHLRELAMDLPYIQTNVKRGRIVDFAGLSNILAAMTFKTTNMIRIKGVPENVGNKTVKTDLEKIIDEVFTLYHERYPLKGELLDVKTGYTVAVCEFSDNFSIVVKRIPYNLMIKIKLLKMQKSIHLVDLEIQSALALRRLNIKEIYLKGKENELDYTALCEYQNEDESTNYSSQENIDIRNVQSLRIEQSDVDIEKSLIFRTTELSQEEIKRVLAENGINVMNIYEEKCRKQIGLSNIRTGDRIAVCKPFNKDNLPQKIQSSLYNADLCFERSGT